MFRRGRGRPLLGAAVVVGASRSAARHEVEKQGQRSAEAQLASDRAADARRREEEERDRRTQLAIDEAITKERSRTDKAERAPPYTETNTGQRGMVGQAGQVPHDTRYVPSLNENERASLRYCSACGHAGKREDKFCATCGHKQPTDDGKQNLVDLVE